MTELRHFALFLLLHVSKSEEIKYELSVTTPSFTYDKTIHNEEVVTSEEHAFSITILNDFPVLRPDNHDLEEIVPGAFDNQNITEEIRFTGTKLRKISSGTFKDLQIRELTLLYNNIEVIEENAISNLPNLWQLYLSHNKIVTVHQNSVVDTPKMWTFDISHNKLKKLGRRWLSLMKKNGTVIVGASYNEIQEIDPEAFSGITVWNLALANNNLTTIPGEVFRNNSLQLLELQNNNLRTLDESFYEQKNLTNVRLEGNPLECSEQKKLKDLEGRNGVRILYDRQNC